MADRPHAPYVKGIIGCDTGDLSTLDDANALEEIRVALARGADATSGDGRS